MLKYAISWFWKIDDTNLSLDEAYKVLDSAKEAEPIEMKEDTTTQLTNFSSFHKTGVITSKRNGRYTIDNVYEYQSQVTNLEVGMQVSFIIYDSNGKIKISNLVITDDWSLEPTNSHSSWCVRSLICKVDKRQERCIIVTPGDITIDLNSVNLEFVPIIGDWINVEAKVELDENVTDLFGKILEVTRITPLRPRILQGRIKEWCNVSKTGCIDQVVYINQDALAPGYIPAIGDKVITQAIESDQSRFTYRALKVVADQSKKLESTNFESTRSNFDISNSCIYVSGDIDINSTRFGDQKNFAFNVINKSDDVLMLISITIESNTTQLKFQKPDSLKNIQLIPNETVKFEGTCILRNIGVSKELILFTFPDFKIGRWVYANLEINPKYDKARSANRGSLLLANTKFRRDFSMVKGQRVIAAPRFISVRLPDYPVPQKLFEAVKKYQDTDPRKLLELHIMKPSLNMPLSFNIYEDRLHSLIHLEEICEILGMRSYANDLTCFIPNGEYLMLEISNLSERRPSILVGDKIIAKDPHRVDSLEYEGYIHKLSAKHAYIKFAPSYHSGYDGEDVSIIAVSSRICFRRRHQAVGLAVRNLGAPFLFPTKVESKPPQVSFVYDPYADDLEGINNSSQDTKPITNNDSNITEKSIKSELLLDTVEDIPKHQQNYPDKQKATQKLEWYNKSMNYYQKEAVRNILLGEARPLPYLIFGPPGTGKTITLVEAILQILQLIPHSRLLVATPSNSAADVLAIRLIDSGVLKPGDLIRLVAYRCVVENMIPVKLIPYCATIDIAKDGTRESMFTFPDNGLTIGCNSSVIGRHRVTVGTCTSLGALFNMGFSKGHFTHIFIDEAGQLTEPEILIPMVNLDIFSGQVVLAGDPLQLGPVIISSVAINYGFDETFLDRMLSRSPYARDHQGFPNTGGYNPKLITRLVYNYRSLPEVLTLTSNLFYDGDLIPTISETDSEEIRLLKQVQEILPQRKSSLPPAIVFHGVLGEHFQTADCPSWVNPNEASQVFFYVNELYRLGVKSTDIGIMSTYIKQVRQIRALLTEAEFEVPKVGTVEEFQGQEFPIILLSTVRSSKDLVVHDAMHKLGFIFMQKRVNVAISRAKVLLIIVGNPKLLSMDVHWRSIIKYCIENNSYCGYRL